MRTRLGSWLAAHPADVVDVFVYVVILNLAIEYLPTVISESFSLSLLTALLLKVTLEVVLLVKGAVMARLRTAATRRARTTAAVMLWAVAADLTHGDSATVSMQYSFLPSPLSFLADRENARNAGRALFDAVYERWSQLPAGERPRLYAFGESLGSYGAEAAFSGEFDMANRLSGAVFTGPPGFNHLFGAFVEGRDDGTPQIEPSFRDGRTVRFTLDPRRPAGPADRPWDGARVLYMVHPSDAITWWNTDVILSRPDWLEEPRGADVLDQTRWVPFVTFWQLSADLGLAMEPGPGYGHNFAGEHVDAWAQVLGLQDWSTGRSDAIREAVLTQSRDPFGAP